MLQLLGDIVPRPPIEVLPLDPVGECRHQTLSSRPLNFRAMAAPVANLELKQEAQLSPSNRAMRLVSSNLASYHATAQKLLIRQVLTKPMV